MNKNKIPNDEVKKGRCEKWDTEIERRIAWSATCNGRRLT